MSARTLQALVVIIPIAILGGVVGMTLGLVLGFIIF